MILEILKVLGALGTISMITTAAISPSPSLIQERTIQTIQQQEIEAKILQKVQEEYPSCFLPSPTFQTCPFVSPFFILVPEDQG